MSTHMPGQGFSDFSRFLHYFVLGNLATSSIRVIIAKCCIEDCGEASALSISCKISALHSIVTACI